MAKIIQTLGFVDDKAVLERGVRPAMTTCQRPSPAKKNAELSYGMAETLNHL